MTLMERKILLPRIRIVLIKNHSRNIDNKIRVLKVAIITIMETLEQKTQLQLARELKNWKRTETTILFKG